MKRKRNKPCKTKFQTLFHVKDGFHLKEVDPSSRDGSGKGTCFFYIIAREEIEACDTTRLLDDLRPEPDNPFFKVGPGNVIFSVSGYDDDLRYLVQIPEVCTYFRKVQQQAPCWLYFAMPGDEWLRIILVAGTHDCRTLDGGGSSRIAVTKSQVAEFMESQLKDYYRLREMIGIGGAGIDSHLYETMKDSFPELLSPPMNN